MNKFFHWVAVILLLEIGITTGCAEPSEQTMRDASVTFLKAVISDLLQNPETAKYFPGVKIEDVTLSQQKNVAAATGWIYHWDYAHDVHDVPTMGNVQRATAPVFENSHAIVFSLFVSYDKGDTFVSRIRNYPILEKSHLTASLYLKTGDDNAPLQKIDEIIKAHLPAFQKAVTAP